MNRLTSAILGLAVMLLGGAVSRADGIAAQLVSPGSLIGTIARSRTVTASAYTLSPRSRMGRALVAAARGGASVTLVLDGEGLAGATRSNQKSAQVFAAAGVRVESAYQDGDLSEGMMPAGQGVGLVRKIMPAGEIVREMVADAERVLGALAPGSPSRSDI